jgi:hypothetical protein
VYSGKMEPHADAVPFLSVINAQPDSISKFVGLSPLLIGSVLPIAEQADAQLLDFESPLPESVRGSDAGRVIQFSLGDR